MTPGTDQDDFERLVADIQREVEAQEAQIYTSKVIEAAHHPEKIGRMTDPDAYGKSRSWCGDMMEMYLRLDGQRIETACFMTDGCGPTIACGNVLAGLVEGQTLEEAGEILPHQVLDALDGLPEESVHCAELAVSTLQNALFNWRAAHEEAT